MNGCLRERKRKAVKQDAFLHVDKTETTQCLRQGGDDGAVALGVIEELKEGRGDELVVARYGKVRLLRQLNHEELSVFLGLGDMRWNVGILGWLKVWPPPVPDCVFNDPFLKNRERLVRYYFRFLREPQYTRYLFLTSNPSRNKILKKQEKTITCGPESGRPRVSLINLLRPSTSSSPGFNSPPRMEKRKLLKL